jgi:hypothetical protein
MGTFHIQSPKELSYIHCPRTGLAMKHIISDWLKPNFRVNDTDSWMIDHPNLQMVREHIPTGKTMTVVRNPWMRVWSLYRKISKEGYWLDWNDQKLIDLKPFDDWLEDYANPNIPFIWPRWFNRFTNMIDFLNYSDNHGDVQWVDFILKAENLETDFKQVQDYLECKNPLPDISHFDNSAYKKHYSSKGIEYVYKVYKRDIDFFNYQF